MDDLVDAAKCVLFDFDGPICDLFGRHPAPLIAARMRALIEERGAAGLLTGRLSATEDPQVILHGLRPASALTVELERVLTEEEMRAAATAPPTPYAEALIRALAAAGHAVAVTTNNSPRAAEHHLAMRGLARCFGGRVHGRREDLRLLKPHPDCLERALASAGARPAEAMMIGDTVNDLLAAQAAGVPFLGYAPRPERRAALRAAGAVYTVASLREILPLVGAPTLG